MADPLLYFLDKLGTWPSGLAFASQWFVILDINSVPALKGAVLKSNLNKLEPKWAIDPSVSSHLMTPQFQDNPQELIGCIFAREVDYPGESISVGYESLNAAGIMAPPTTSGREVYNKFSITVLETNASFVDFVLRPWTILVGQHGLIARASGSNKNIRCPLIKIYLLAKVGEGKQFEVRKSINFINAAPVSVGNFVNSYEQEGIKYTKVEFVYDHYFISSERASIYTGGSIQLPVPPSLLSTTNKQTKPISPNSAGVSIFDFATSIISNPVFKPVTPKAPIPEPPKAPIPESPIPKAPPMTVPVPFKPIPLPTVPFV